MSMPFGLKSAYVTYQRCVQNCLHKQIGRNVHAYVDDIVVKSREAETLISDLRETFDNLRVYKMMLNPEKCVFGVPAGKLLGFLVSNRGIEANPEKIKAITSLVNRHVSMMFSVWQAGLQPSADLSAVSERRRFPCIRC